MLNKRFQKCGNIGSLKISKIFSNNIFLCNKFPMLMSYYSEVMLNIHQHLSMNKQVICVEEKVLNII